MKTLFSAVISVVLSSALYANVNAQAAINTNELSWVDEQVEAIKPARTGIKNYKIDRLKNPFVFLKPIDKAGKSKRRVAPRVTTTHSSSQIQPAIVHSSSSLALEAVINKSALINGRWYKEGQNVYGYTLKKVSGNTIYLTKNNKTKVLTTKVKHTSLKFNNN